MTETWAPVVKYEGLYEISSMGRVRSLPRLVRAPVGMARLKGRILIQHPDRDGRALVSLSKDGKPKTFVVSHLVAAAFIGARPVGTHVCHNNGNEKDNRPENLRYDTPLANARDKELHGTQTRGDTHPSSKMTEEEVIALRLLAPHVSRAFLSYSFKISKSHVGQLISRTRWAHLPI